jgi:hypothetical protein
LAPQRAQGRLDLAFVYDGICTRLDRFYQEGCLKARLPHGLDVEAVALNISGALPAAIIWRRRWSWRAALRSPSPPR